MTELDIIVENKYNGNSHLKENFYYLITIANHNIFDIKKKTELLFFSNYIKKNSVMGLLLIYIANSGRK